MRGWNSTSCLLKFGHINWPANPKTHRRIITVEYGAFLLVLFLAAGLGCSLFQIRCREDDPRELMLAESQVYLKENIIHIKEEKHCVEHIRLNSSRVMKKQSSDVKVKACCKCIQKSDFWNLLPFRNINWVENEYDLARSEHRYVKATVKQTYGSMRTNMLENNGISILDMEEVKSRTHQMDQLFDDYISVYCDFEKSHQGLMGVNLPSSLEDYLWHWNQLLEDVKDDLREGTKGNIDGATYTLDEEIVTEDHKDRGAKLGATAPSSPCQYNQTLNPQPPVSTSSVNQAHPIFKKKEPMVRGADGTMTQQMVDKTTNIVVFSIKEERDQTSSHHMWPSDCLDKGAVELKLHRDINESVLSRVQNP